MKPTVKHHTSYSTTPIQFEEIVGGYIVGGVIFVELVGLRYIHQILQSAGPIDCSRLFYDGELLSEFKSERASSEDRERHRQSVRRAIARAFGRLTDTRATEHIGNHLMAWMRTGQTCEYIGNWKWEL